MRRGVHRIEGLALVALVVHGCWVLAVTEGPITAWWLLTAAVGVGAWALVSPRASAWTSIRAAVMTGLMGWLLVVTGGAGSFFLLWGFVVVAVYPGLLSERGSVALTVAAAGTYLSVALATGTAGRFPPPVLVGRVFLIVLIGLVTSSWVWSQRRSAERARAVEVRRRELELVYSRVVDQAGDAIVLVDDEGLIARFNRMAEETFGWPSAEVVGRSVEMLVPADCDDSCRRDIRRMLDGGEADGAVLRHGVRRDGTVFPAVSSVAVVESPGRARLVVIVRDATNEQASRRRLEDLIQSKDTFVASVSHELRTPLSAVVGFSAEIADRSRSLGESEREELALLVHQQAVEVSHIVEDLLVAARADIGQITMIIDQVDVAAQVAGVLDDHCRLRELEPGSIRVVGEVGRAVGDAGRIRQIIRNLVLNAERYGGTNIHVELMGGSGFVEVRVVDDGDGIPPEARDRLFEPYERFHEDTGRPGSIGLGLSVSRSLARLMGGELSYERFDGHSCFVLRLPATAG